ncbi:ABC-type amino acid transport substrate-binding protein [Tamilnaduibacter salinus]|uniref:ABC-type amino acid transport substrate-binding protein n=1 Tax=Tamilnaduibacter salinus TaxID=1484056 RepID=A0A2U1D069_9GAMM|nr:transporter substrate-binding domain-containing protein [Tamilnaduibacter salinus]PVY78429.1 ABC-type amino acid transport substrate-binding protein [Tamilnaduibacter salinus]
MRAPAVRMAVAAMLFVVSLGARGQSLPGACDVVVGPTSDEALTQANLDWTRTVLDRVEAMGTPCELYVINAWARANKMFADGEAEVLFPEIVGDRTQPGMTGMPVARTHGFVLVTAKGASRIDGIRGLAGKTVGVVRGRFYPSELRNDPSIELEEARSFQQNVDKLLYGRIDATIEYRQDVMALLARRDLSEQLNIGDEFGGRRLAYRFHLTRQGARLMALFNVAISELVLDGTYHRIFEDSTQELVY